MAASSSSRSGVAAELLLSGSPGKPPEKQHAAAAAAAAGPAPRRKGHAEKSVLDDIMDDPDDFGDLGDSDADSDAGGRWEDTLRKRAQDSSGVEEVLQDEVVERKENLLGKVFAVHIPMENGGQIQHGIDQEVAEGDTINGMVQHSVQKKRYFIIKSLNYHNIEKSIQRGIWATQAMNEPVLNEAFESVDKVILIFSVNMSGHFQGYAQMISAIGQRRANVWSEASWGGTFSVEWIQLYDLPFQKTLHLKNPLNSFKPVKISRDCQELTEEIGEALCSLIDEGADRDGNSKRKLSANGGFIKRPCIGRSPPGDNGLYGVASMKGHIPPFVYPGSFLPLVSVEPHYPPRAGRLRNCSKSKSPVLFTNVCDQREAENLRGHGAGAAREEDLLNMSYEEYLRSQGNPREQRYYQDVDALSSNQTVVAPNGERWMGNHSNADATDDEYANYLANWYATKQRAVAEGCYYSGQTISNSYPANSKP